jgi:CHAT domain-containing protein/tetratricopeptide (TPR) repeat protein
VISVLRPLILLVPLVLAAQTASDNRAYRAAFDRLITEGKYPEAEAAARAAVAKAQTEWGPESLQTALALDTITEAYFYGDRVRDPEAEANGLAVIALKEKVFGPENPEVAISLRLMGHLLEVQADYQRARQFYERAVAVHETVTGHEPRQEANALDDLGRLLAKTGDLGEARATFERALAIRLKNFAPDTLNTAGIRVNYATLLRDLGEYEKAQAQFGMALAIYQAKLGATHVINTPCMNELGVLLNLMGRPAEARQLLERTLAIEESAYGPDHVELAFVLKNLANARVTLGELEAARPLYERALRIVEPVYGPDHPETGRILSEYAALLLRLGEKAPALAAAIRTEQIGREHVALTIRSLPERQALLYAAKRATGLDVLLAIAATEPAARIEALDAVIRSRALVFDEMAARHRAIAQMRDPAVSRLAGELSSARARLSGLVVQGPEGFRGNTYAVALGRARQEVDRAGRALAERSAQFRDELAQRAAGLHEVAAALQEGDALVSFVRSGAGSYAAFVQTAGADTPALIQLGAARTIDNLVAGVRKQILAEAEAPGVSPVRSEALYRAAGEALRRQVWDPLQPALRGSRRIFLTPADALNLIDFGALPSGGGSYLAERGPVLHYLSAERDLTVPAAHQRGAGLLALGNPSFDSVVRGQKAGPIGGAALVVRGARSPCADFASLRFDPLPASALEVKEIGAVWRNAGEGQVIERVGDAANEAALKLGGPGKRVLHIAAHAFFLSDRCSSEIARIAGENPLLLSGMALAGANRRQNAAPGAEDGIVTAEEIAALDLDGVEWAVLSGCETGVGKLLPGEGVFGLRRAFQVAGARTVIMSLWPVDDGSTRTWMTALYRERFTRGQSAANSVRAASLAALAKRRAQGLSTHPFYWAGFIAAGDWR